MIGEEDPAADPVDTALRYGELALRGLRIALDRIKDPSDWAYQSAVIGFMVRSKPKMIYLDQALPLIGEAQRDLERFGSALKAISIDVDIKISVFEPFTTEEILCSTIFRYWRWNREFHRCVRSIEEAIPRVEGILAELREKNGRDRRPRPVRTEPAVSRR